MHMKLEGLIWRVISPSRYELVGDNRVVVFRHKGWAIMIDGRQIGGLHKNRNSAMRVVCFALWQIEVVRSGGGLDELVELGRTMLGKNFNYRMDYHGLLKVS